MTDTDGLLRDAGGERIRWTCGCGQINAGWATHCGRCNWTAGGERPKDDLSDVPQWVRDFPAGTRIYRAGLAAGRARAIEDCARLCNNYPADSDVTDNIAASIRSLNAPAASADD